MEKNIENHPGFSLASPLSQSINRFYILRLSRISSLFLSWGYDYFPFELLQQPSNQFLYIQIYLQIFPYCSSAVFLKLNSDLMKKCSCLKPSSKKIKNKTLQQVTTVLCLFVSCSFVPDSMQPHGLQPATLLRPCDFSGKNTGVANHSLLQGIFRIQGSNLGLLHCRQTLYSLSH